MGDGSSEAFLNLDPVKGVDDGRAKGDGMEIVNSDELNAAKDAGGACG